ncbi:universal stress protein [Natronococcus pandeyae]|uniref:Universal stress protein n=1 Tax=Natronococcus pandeyae TaxID=2055836 RepID=A0A8J8Q0F8_9EURY|nr:universal stress protein [Natronococcus pandeyae]TYL36514.1 universal stress protein [Natronococcus pandeyae]
MYDTILIPTDGSATAERALNDGLDIARRYGATVHALSVIDVAELLEVDYLGDRSDFEATIEPLEDEAKRAVSTVEEYARQLDDVEVITVVREGDPYETIVAYADDVDADLIVMGTHGRRGLPRYLLGSTTERVIRTVDVPVMAVRTPEE